MDYNILFFMLIHLVEFKVYGINEEDAFIEYNHDADSIINTSSRYVTPCRVNSFVFLNVDSLDDVDSSGDNFNNSISCMKDDMKSPTRYTFIGRHKTLRAVPYCEWYKTENKNYRIFGGTGDGPSSSLEQLIEDNRSSNGVLLVDFFATWCGPCNTMKKHLNTIEEHYRSDKLKIYKIDVDKNPEYTSKYRIAALPTLILFTKGKIYTKIVGLVDIDKLFRTIDKALDSI